MINAKIKSQEEQQRLDDALRTSRQKSWYRRLQIIVNSAKGATVKQLSVSFNLSKATIRKYIKAYNQGGIDKLRPVKQTGRPSKIGHWTKQDWEKILERTPDQYEKLGICSHRWTLELMRRYLKEYHEINVGRSSISNSLRKAGWRTGRSKLHVGSPDPEYEVKKQQIGVLEGLPKRGN
jgi:transposase